MEPEEPAMIRRVCCSISYRMLVLFSELVVLLALVVSIVTSLIFQFDEVIDKDCGDATPNFLASISAVTSVSPQRYLWRVSIALHSTPRIVMALAYFSSYLAASNRLFALRSRTRGRSEECEREQVIEADGESSQRQKPVRKCETANCWCSRQSIIAVLWRLTRTRSFYRKVAVFSFLLNMIEIFSLMGIAYISNRDNYEVHEKMFEAFGISHLSYAFATLWLTKRLHEPPSPCAGSPQASPQIQTTQRHARRHGLAWTPAQRASYELKWRITISVLTLSVVIACLFVSHTVFCVPYTFTFFALGEYIAVLGNMAFHYTAVYDFPGAVVLVGTPTAQAHNESRVSNGHPVHAAANGNLRTQPDIRELHSELDCMTPHFENTRRRSGIGIGESEKQLL